MTDDMLWISSIPPIVALGIILWKKEVIGALLITIFVSELLILLTAGDTTSLSLLPMSIVQTMERIIGVVSIENNARILGFALLIGVLMSYLQTSGGIAATVYLLINKNIITNRKRAGIATVVLSSLIFVSTYVSSITTGILSRGIFDKFGMSRARLAYMIDSTAAPICLILLFNSFGAYLLALIDGYEFEQTGISILMGTVVYNFYAFIALAMVYHTAFSDKVYGPMKQSEETLNSSTKLEEVEVTSTKARYMVIPVVILVSSVFGVLYWTGNGEITRGSGSKAVFYAIGISALVAYLMMIVGLKKDHKDMVKDAFTGISGILPLFFIIMFSITLGASLKELGTGPFVASLIDDYLPVYFIVPFFFLAGGVISFATGSSFGAFAILIPMAVPLIHSLGIPPSFILAAVIGGGTFGDHSSPISDTSVIASLSAGCDHLEHVKTQLPYTMVGGAIAFILYFIVSFTVLS